MSSIDTETFGDVSAPDTIEQLLAAVYSRHPKYDRVRMWRGQGDIAWPIHSSAYRRLELTKPTPTESNVKSYETHLLEQATHKGFRQYNGQLLSDLELLARLQHHGAATRLVDFTRNALAALWFACSDAHDKHGALIGIHSAYIGGYESKVEVRTYAEIVGEAEEIEHPITWEPTGVSPRITAQHSQFLYSSVGNDVSGSLKVPKEDDQTLVLAITPDMKQIALEILEQSFDIRSQTLFPDLDGFCAANSHRVDERHMHRW